MTGAGNERAWFAAGAATLGVVLGLFIAPTLPVRFSRQDPESLEIGTGVRLLCWFDPAVPFGSANVLAWLAIAALLGTGTLSVLSAVRPPHRRATPAWSPAAGAALTSALAIGAVAWGGGESALGWVACALLLAATAGLTAGWRTGRKATAGPPQT